MIKTTDKLENFMNGFVAAVQLSHRAGKNGFFIEYILLIASIIDGMLRISLMLQYQLETKSNKVLDALLYQSNEDKIISERKIYKISLDKKIISKKLFDDLEKLYKQRNRVIHRYIISDISTKEVLNIGIQYEQVKYLVSDCVETLESKQIKSGIGMTRREKNTTKENLHKMLNEMSSKKHNNIILNRTLKNH